MRITSTDVLSRREWLTRLVAVGAAASGVRGLAALRWPEEPGRLLARPRVGVRTSVHGVHPLGLDAANDALLRVPATTTGPVPLVVGLHGATQDAPFIMRVMGDAADEAGCALLAPKSLGYTWDAIRGEFDADVRRIDQALRRVYDLVEVDPRRVILAGFSDGASYALSLGIINGDAFSRVIACSPGFVIDGAPHGKAPIFISHGTRDRILPIDSTSRRLVPALRRAGYDVTYREFDGGHQVPPELFREALAAATGRSSGSADARPR